MSETIPIVCPHCSARLNAKAALIGRRRPCPKCKNEILIAPAPAAESGSGAAQAAVGAAANNGRSGSSGEGGLGNQVAGVMAEGLPSHRFLIRLNRHHLYYICDRAKVFASWENNGQGWQVRAQSGMVSAVRNQHLLPQQGDFRLVEIHAEHTPEGVRLRGLTCYRLADRWALRSLARGDDEIVEKIVDHAGLSREQKNAVRAALRERFMHEVWQHAGPLAEFLGNADYHSYQVLFGS